MTNDENQSKNDSNELLDQFKKLYTSETDEKNKEADLEKIEEDISKNTNNIKEIKK